MLHRPGLPAQGFHPSTYPYFCSFSSSFSWEARLPRRGPEVQRPHRQHHEDISYPGWSASGAGLNGLVRVPSPSGSLGNFAGSPEGSFPPEPSSPPATRWEVVAWPFASDSLPRAFSCRSCISKRRWAPFILEMSSFFLE